MTSFPCSVRPEKFHPYRYIHRIHKIQLEHENVIAEDSKIRWSARHPTQIYVRFTRSPMFANSAKLWVCAAQEISSAIPVSIKGPTRSVNLASIYKSGRGQYIYKSIHLRPSPVTTNWSSYKGRAIWFSVNYMETPASRQQSIYINIHVKRVQSVWHVLITTKMSGAFSIILSPSMKTQTLCFVDRALKCACCFAFCIHSKWKEIQRTYTVYRCMYVWIYRHVLVRLEESRR